jgi:hypothetical protein
MADILDQIQARQLHAQKQEIAAKQHDLDWNATFGRMAPEEVLRETRNMTELIGSAVEKKMQLAAQTNEAAQRIWVNDQRFKAEQRVQPLKDELLQWQVRHEEASTAAVGLAQKFRMQKDAEAMADLAGFYDTVGQIKDREGTPGYIAGINAAVQRFPRIIGTQAGSNAIKQMHTRHQDVEAITPKEGFMVDRYEVTDDGKTRAIFKPIPPPVKVPAGMEPFSATTTGGKTTVTLKRPDAPKTTTSTIEGVDAVTGKPFTAKKTMTTGTPEQVQAAEQKAMPANKGKDFLKSLGITPKAPKSKVIPAGPVEG